MSGEVEDTVDETGTDEGAQDSSASGIERDDDGGKSDSSTKSPDDKGGGGGGVSDDKAPKPRTLAEMSSIGHRDSFKPTEAESKRIRIAAEQGFTTDEEVDNFLGEKKGKDSSKSDEGDDDDPDGADKAKNKSDDKATDDDKVDEKEPLFQLLTAIAPHISDKAETMEDIVQGVKDLAHKQNRAGEFVNKANKIGFDSIEKLQEASDTIANLDASIKDKLNSKEGVKALYAAYGLTPPDWVGAAGSGDNGDAGKGKSADIPALDEYTKGLEDDGYVTGKDVKPLADVLVNHLTAAFKENFDKLEQISTFVQNYTQQSQKQQMVARTYQSAKDISERFGKLDESLKLSVDPQTIISQSLTREGKPLSKQHAEFPKLQKIFGLIKNAYADAKEKKTAPNVMAYLSDKYFEAGGLQNLEKNAGQKATQEMITKLFKKLQPSLGKGKGKGSETDPFKTPKTAKDVEKMSRKNKKAFLKKFAKGEYSLEQ